MIVLWQIVALKKDDLLMRGCTLVIQLSSAVGNQINAKDLKITSKIANVRIYVEQATRKMKVHNILKIGLPLTEGTFI